MAAGGDDRKKRVPGLSHYACGSPQFHLPQKSPLKQSLQRWGIGESQGELLDRALRGIRARFGILRCPVFGRKGDAPEHGAWLCKLQTNLGFAAAHRAE